MDADLAVYLDKVKERRSELGESMAALQAVLDQSPDDMQHWLATARAAATQVRADLADHIEVTEAAGGLYDSLRAEAARLAGPLRQLQAEHPDLAALADELIAVLAHEQEADRAAAPALVKELLRRLSHHRQRGGDLIFEAYQVDVGGTG
jgi:hypothetical protein